MRIKRENEVLWWEKCQRQFLNLGWDFMSDRFSLMRVIGSEKIGCFLNCEHKWPEIAINFNLTSNFIPAVYIYIFFN